ncbi:MAG: tRNA uridine-5-carboxymethylaminomethyl(34) synthesis enzyme MnmG [Rickettsiales bacterium]|jgi:tRNA uridine 5-carboxymethylaminomethyl modification enzyme|nr:tRNA uridine-5-carboxymethylaminomethyl(34) synthesis enzyme MnmG [Rickettsiales bacterium]
MRFDVAVIGGGHAGVEAAAAASRLGAKTALITFSKTNLGQMSCNPSIGGLGKGHLVREIDALGGLMALAADAAAVQYRILNESKGAAVRGLRIQADRGEYKRAISALLSDYENLKIIEGEVLGFVHTPDGFEINLKSINLKSSSLVLTTGTFLNGLMHTGREQRIGGRIGEPASSGISKSLVSAGFSLLRLKTGTPARLSGKTINYAQLERQQDQPPTEAFSFLNPLPNLEQLPCFITHTNAATHDIIRAAIPSSPLFDGTIKGTGPRYCPSIEDKIARFPHHESHHVFLEPEGRATDTVYPNGISTSLPSKVQDEFIHSIKGLEQVEILEYGYAVEYDAIDARELAKSLESKRLPGLFCAGQINGTSGYEEAAAQGIIAGTNAALQSQGRPPLTLDRTQAFIGVMIDDITTLGVDEPYRMFTSRSEYRLSLRQDNADLRLTPLGLKIGLISKKRAGFFKNKLEKIKAADTSDPRVKAYLETEIHYAPYLKRQSADIAAYERDKALRLPADADYKGLPGLTLELAGKLDRARPATLADTARIPGMTPAALSLLLKVVRARQPA